MSQIPNLVDGNALPETALMKFIASDVEGSTASGTETEVATVQVPASAVNSGILILATIENRNAGGTGDTNNGVFYLRVGTSASVTSNAQVETKTLKLELRDTTNGDQNTSPNTRISGSFLVFYTGATWTSLNYVSISAEADGTNDTSYCNQLTVLGF